MSELRDSDSQEVLVCGFAPEHAFFDGNNTLLDHRLSSLEGDGVPPKDSAEFFSLCCPSDAECRCGWATIHSSFCMYCGGHYRSNEVVPDSDSDSISASPINGSSCGEQHAQPRQTRLTRRESLLQEAWERKRELHDKVFANFKESTDIRTLGRSSSDCSRSLGGIGNRTSLERSKSDCVRPNKGSLIALSGHGKTQTRNLTDDDFEELEGFLDLGFRFGLRSIPDLCETLPALEAVSAVTQTFQDSLTASSGGSFVPSPSPPIWSITRPGDGTEEMKEKLRHWARAVACSARLYPSVGELAIPNVIQCTL